MIIQLFCLIVPVYGVEGCGKKVSYADLRLLL